MASSAGRCYPAGMTDDPPPNLALLPAGFRDMLPPEAETEAASVESIMAAFAAHGYQRVKPPLIEYEESLLAASGAAVADQTFRLMDPETHRMVGLRADMTPQVARIAATRLAHLPRPLRLSYAGQVLRVRANGLAAPDRQIAQAGIELIGPDSPRADAEVVVVAAEALETLGLTRISFDLTMPPLVQSLLGAAALPPERTAALARALDYKDAAEIASLGGDQAAVLIELLRAAGPAEATLAVLTRVDLPPGARAHAAHLAETVAAIRSLAPALRLTLDPVEFRGFRYHTGVCTTIYAPGQHEELGRGGRYLCGEGEPATGLTLFPDAVLRAAPPRRSRARVYLPLGADPFAAAAVRARGFATVAGFEREGDDASAARRLRCGHVLRGDILVQLDME